MRICFIGNSQIAALKRGWEEMSLPPATFFAAPSKLPETLAVDGDRLVAPDGMKARFEMFCGISSIQISDFDVFVLVGLNYGISRCADLFLSSRPILPNVASLPPFMPVSRSCYSAAAAALLRKSTAVKIALRLRVATSASIIIVPEPAIGETIKDERSSRGRTWRAIDAAGPEAFYSLFLEAGEALLAEKVEMLPQPHHTLCGYTFTAKQYVTGRYKLGGELRENDIFDHSHMTADFGRAVAGSVLEFLNSRSQPVSVAGLNRPGFAGRCLV